MAYITVKFCQTLKTDAGGDLFIDFEGFALCERSNSYDKWEVVGLSLDENDKRPIAADGNFLERAVWSVIPDIIEIDQNAIDEEWTAAGCPEYRYGEVA